MKKLIFFLSFICCSFVAIAQNTYTVDGETYELKTEVTGSMDLLWNIIDGEYRYFVKKGNTISELKNTKGSDNKYDEAYKSVLTDLTQDSDISVEKVRFTLYSLSQFVNDYNASVDPNYSAATKKGKLQTRVLVFAGVSNSPFVENPENESNGMFGVEIELFGAERMPKHSLFFQVKHVQDGDEFDFSTTQLGLGYRFRIINANAVNFYANVIAATYNFSKSTFTYIDENDMVVSEKRSGSSFDVPFIFGVGADIRITDNSFITLTYDELFAAFLDNQGNFSRHFAIGYKFNL